MDQVKGAGLNTQGVKIITLEPRHKVASLAIVPHEDPNAPVEEETPIDDEVNPALMSEDEAPKANVKMPTPDDIDEDASSDDGASGNSGKGGDDDI